MTGVLNRWHLSTVQRWLLGGLVLGMLSAVEGQAATLTAPFVAVRAYYLLEVESDQPLATLNPDQRVEPASLTKLMTAYLVFQTLNAHKIAPDQPILPSAHACSMRGSRMFIQSGTAVTVEALLHGLIIESGNDAAVALAEMVEGSEAQFVQRMNAMAKTLGMDNTHFANATGLPDAQHYSSARDLALLARALLRNFPEYYPLYGQKEYRYNGITQANRNRLLWMDPAVDGLKTGHTDAAGYCLISSAQRGQRRLLSVVLGASSDLGRTVESQKLLNWGFQAFQSQRLFSKGQTIKNLPLYKGEQSQIAIGFNRDMWVTTPIGQANDVKKTLVTWQPVIAPVVAQQKVGEVRIFFGGQQVDSADLVALQSVALGNAFTRAWDTIKLMVK